MSIKQQLVRILLRGMKEVYMDRIISDKLYLSLLYRRVLDKKMHWDNPHILKSSNEEIAMAKNI